MSLTTLDPKTFLASKTVWANVIAICLFLANHQELLPGLGIPDEYIVVIMAIVNIILRFKTVVPITLSIRG